MLVNMATLGHLYPNIKQVADDPLENPTESPIAVKVEEHSQSLILTYFHGDINSMVDAHFSRALNKASKAKAPATKLKKIHKKIKKEDIRVFQDTPADTYLEPQVRPVTEHLVSFTPAEELCSPWHAFPSRTGEGPALPPMGCSLSPNDLSVTGQQCSASLLNLLHTDRTEMAPSLSSSLSPSLSSSLSSSSKAELLPNWMVPQADPSTVFEPGRRLDKKDLYWY